MILLARRSVSTRVYPERISPGLRCVTAGAFEADDIIAESMVDEAVAMAEDDVVSAAADDDVSIIADEEDAVSIMEDEDDASWDRAPVTRTADSAVVA